MSGIDESKKTSEDDCGAGRCDWGKPFSLSTNILILFTTDLHII